VVRDESLARGRLQVGLAGAGGLRWAAANLTEVVETARARLDLSPVAAAALGRAVTSAALLLRMATKTPLRLLLEIRGDGPLRQVLAEADHAGNLRGTVRPPRVDVPFTREGKLDVGGAIGEGTLRVLREYERGGRYHSQVDLVTGEVGADVAHYLHQSEQTRSAVMVGVLGKPEGVVGAGGLIVEVLPDAADSELDTLEANILHLPGGVSRVLEEGGLDRLLERVLADLAPRVVEERTLHYRCRCSRERLKRHLVLLSDEDRREHALDDGSIEAECLFCGEKYLYPPEELAPVS
jgi:molecular chaperone Hsp33